MISVHPSVLRHMFENYLKKIKKTGKFDRFYDRACDSIALQPHTSGTKNSRGEFFKPAVFRCHEIVYQVFVCGVDVVISNNANAKS